MKVLALTGATGFVGGRVLQVALQKGWHVRALARRPQPEQTGVSWVLGALGDATALRQLCDGADVVLHIAGVVNAAGRDGFALGNIAGTKSIVDAAKAAGVQRFVHVSSLAAREPGLSDYGWSKAGAEAVVERSGLDWTILRPPAVYGPGDTEIFEMFKMAKWRVMILPPKGRISVIHVVDLANLLLAIAPANPELSGQIYEADDGRFRGWSHNGFAKAIGKAMGRRVAAISMPRAVLLVAARIDRLVRGDKAKLTRDRVNYLCHPNWVITAANRPSPRFWKPYMSTRRGLATTVDWYRKNGWL